MSDSDKDPKQNLSTLDLLLDLQNDDDEIFPGRPSTMQQQQSQQHQQPPPPSSSQPTDDILTQPVAAPPPALTERTDDFLIPTPPPPDSTDQLLIIPAPSPPPELSEMQDAPPPPEQQQQQKQPSKPPPPPSPFRTISDKFTPSPTNSKDEQPDADAKTNDISFTFEDTGPGYDFQKKKPPTADLVLPSKTIETALEPRDYDPHHLDSPPPPSSSKKDTLVGMEVPLLSSNTKHRSLSDPYEGDDERAGSLLGSISHASTYTPLSLYTKYEGPCCAKRDIIMAVILLAVVLTGGILIVKSQNGAPPSPPTYPPTTSPVSAAPVVVETMMPSGRPSGGPTDAMPEITFEPTWSPTEMMPAAGTEAPTVEEPTGAPVTESPDTNPPTVPASLTSYCGTDFSDAASCQTPCPTGSCSDPDDTCFSEVTTCTAYENYCGATLDEAKEECDKTCPTGEDYECGEGEKCWTDVAECVKR